MKTLSFQERYPGPQGPHLSLLTGITRHGKPGLIQISIHPGGRPAVDTSKPRRLVRNKSGFGVRRTKTRRSANWSK